MTTTPQITVASDPHKLRIYMDGHLHLMVRRSQIVGMQSWREKKARWPFKIEFTSRQGDRLFLEYDDVEKWKAILAAIDDGVAKWR